MTVFLILLLTVVAFACAIYPLLRKKPSLSNHSVEDENLQELQSQRDTTYSMLKEVEFDYQSGILSPDDYEELQKRYKRKAIVILRDMDGLQTETGADDEIEKKVMARRQGKDNSPPGTIAADKIEEKILALRQRKGQFCPQCGAKHEAVDRFCAHCGTKLFRERKR